MFNPFIPSVPKTGTLTGKMARKFKLYRKTKLLYGPVSSNFCARHSAIVLLIVKIREPAKLLSSSMIKNPKSVKNSIFVCGVQATPTHQSSLVT